MQKRLIYLILILLFLVGAYLRISGTSHGFFAFTFDQGRDLLRVAELVSKKNITLIGPTTGIEGVFHGAWWYWLLIPLYVAVDGDPQRILILFGLINSTCIIIAFYLGKELKDEKTGILAATLVCVSAYFISTSAQLWNPNLVPFLLLLWLLSLWKFIHRRISFFWVGFWLGAVFEFHVGFGSMLVLACVPALILYIRPKLKDWLLALSAFGFWILPRVLFDIRNHFLQIKSLLIYLSGAKATGEDFIFTRLVHHWDTTTGVFAQAFTNSQAFLGGVVFCIVVGFLLSLHKKRTPLTIFIFLTVTIVLGVITVAAFYRGTLWDYYMVGIPSLTLPVVTLALIWLVSQRPRLGVLFVLLLVLQNAPLASILKPTTIADPSVYDTQLAVVDTLYRDAGGQTFNVQVYSPSVIDYSYHYLFSWYGLRTYGYQPDRENLKRLVYYIVEPDKWHPKIQEAWLREREGDGHLQWIIDVPGGIQIHKRLRLNIK